MSQSRTGEKKETLGELVRTVIYALLIALFFRVFLFQPFSIPSSSMKSTLLIGDYLFVSKYAYGYSKHSIPFSIPLFEGRIWRGEPEIGDVIVFKNARDGNKDYIKRLIGKGGDRIQMIGGVLHINGKRVKLEQIEDFVEPLDTEAPFSQVCLRRETRDGEKVCIKEQFIETLPNGRQHHVLNADDNTGGQDETGVYEVPPGHYFFMGDNRDNSGDGRSIRVGFVPEEALIGRAEIIFLSSEGSPLTFWEWRFGRFLDLIE